MHLHLPSSDFFSIVKIKVIGMKIKVSLLLATAALSLSAAVAHSAFRLPLHRKVSELLQAKNVSFIKLYLKIHGRDYPENIIKKLMS